MTFRFYQLLYGPIVFVKASYRQLLLLGAMFIIGAAIFVYFEHLPITSAFLASVSTITTIGLYVPTRLTFCSYWHHEQEDDRGEIGVMCRGVRM